MNRSADGSSVRSSTSRMCVSRRAQLGAEPQLLLDPLDVLTHRRPWVPASLAQRARDRLEREAERAQGEDAIQPADVAFAVEAVTGARPLGRDEQSDLVVVVQRADSHADR